MSDSLMTVADFSSSVRIGSIKTHMDICCEAVCERTGGKFLPYAPMSLKNQYNSTCSIPGLLLQLHSAVSRYIDPEVFRVSKTVQPLSWRRAVELASAPEKFAQDAALHSGFWKLHPRFSAADAAALVRIISTMRYSTENLFGDSGFHYFYSDAYCGAGAGGADSETDTPLSAWYTGPSGKEDFEISSLDGIAQYNRLRTIAEPQVSSSGEYAVFEYVQPVWSITSYLFANAGHSDRDDGFQPESWADAHSYWRKSITITSAAEKMFFSAYIPEFTGVQEYFSANGSGSSGSSQFVAHPGLSTGLITVSSGGSAVIDLSVFRQGLPVMSDHGKGFGVTSSAAFSAVICSGFETNSISSGILAVYDLQNKFKHFNGEYEL